MSERISEMSEREFLEIITFRNKLTEASATNIYAYANRRNITSADALIKSLKKDIDLELEKLTDEAITEEAYKIDPNDPKAITIAKEKHIMAIKMYQNWIIVTKEIFQIK